MNATERFLQIQNMLKDEPDDVFLNYSLAIEFLAMNQHDQAIQAFGKVIDLNSEYIPAYYQLGKIHEALSLNTEALDYFKKGLELARQQKNNKAINEFGEAVFMLED